TRAKLTEEQLLALTQALKSAGPLEVPKLLAAFENCSDEKIGVALVQALHSSKGVATLGRDTIKQRLGKFPTPVQDSAFQLLDSLNVDSARQRARIDEMIAELKGGDIRRGQALFNSAKAACSSCHAIGYMGGNVGPDLTRIGQIRTDRDLLESILYPSASFVRSFEPMIVTTKAGEEYSGVVKADNTEEVLLATGP